MTKAVVANTLLAIQMQGKKLALSELKTISTGKFMEKERCRDFFSALIKNKNLDISVESLMGELATVAGQVYTTGNVWDGPSSGTELTVEKFDSETVAGGVSGGYNTVGGYFGFDSSREALSQSSGLAIWIRPDRWEPAFFGLGSSSYDGAYGLGTLMHELLHKEMVGGGFDHEDMKTALKDIGMDPKNYTLYHNTASDQLGQICF